MIFIIHFLLILQACLPLVRHYKLAQRKDMLYMGSSYPLKGVQTLCCIESSIPLEGVQIRSCIGSSNPLEGVQILFCKDQVILQREYKYSAI